MDMGRRKSHGNVLLENSTSSTSRAVRRGSGILIRPPNINLNVNDDEAERASLRLASVKQTSIIETPNNRRSLNLEVIVNMTSPQIVDGIAECIKLNTQNKINSKNAFSLNMIDFMSWMVKNKQQGIDNLQMAAVGIDVSAKIYALRVDDLHNKTLNMAGNLDPEDKDRAENENTEDVNADIERSQALRQSQKKKKKRDVNKELFTTTENLEGRKDFISLEPIMFGENDCQLTSLLYQYAFPQHCTQSFIFHPYNDIIIDESGAENLTESNIRIPWPPIHPDSREEINSLYTDFEFINYSLDSNNSSQNSSQSQSQPQSQPQSQSQLIPQDNNLVFDFDASLPPDNGFENITDFHEVHDNDDDEHRVACNLEPTGPVVLATIENIMDRIPTQRHEYSFFDHSLNIRWVGPSHWKIKSFIKTQGTSQAFGVCTQKPKKNKKEYKLIYSTEKIKINKNKFKKGHSQLKMSTLQHSWDEEKLYLQAEDLFNNAKELLYKLFMRPDTIFAVAKSTDDVAIGLNNESSGYDDNNLDETYNDNLNSQMGDIPLNNNSIHENIELDDIPQDFVGTNLIEAPKLTRKIFIPYSQKAKKLNMYKLKKCIWNELTSVEQNDNEYNTVANTDRVQGEKSFVHLFENLPSKLNKHDAEELSFPIAFVSLLHLANEKCLKISQNDNYSDLSIEQDVL